MPATADERLAVPDHRLGLFATVAIVVGGIVGTGIFTVPAAMADYGWLSMPAFAVAAAVLWLPALNRVRDPERNVPRAIIGGVAEAPEGTGTG